MNRVGLKDYLLNHADDNDLLDCAKAWDSANEYGHLESASKARLLEDARDNIDDIIDWLRDASRYELDGISSDIELMVDAKDPFEVINEVDCSSRNYGNDIEVNLSRGDKKATLSFSNFNGTNSNDIDAEKVGLAEVTYATAKGYNLYADGAGTDEVQTAFFKGNGRRLSAARADKLTAACEKNMDALKRVLKDSEITALDKLFNVELCSESYCATLANEALECKYISSALEKKSAVPMFVMLVSWCIIRITYITITVHFIPKIQVIFWAYPLTWSISSIISSIPTAPVNLRPSTTTGETPFSLRAVATDMA